METSFSSIENKLKELGITSKFEDYSENLVSEIEEKFHITLPSDYRKFLIKYGRVNFSKEICYSTLTQYPSSRSNEDETIVNFYGLQNDHNNIAENIECYLGRIPESLIPIVECPGGDQLCIGVKEEVRGKVYFWDHNREQFQPQKQELWNNVYLTSNSFTDFILSFKVRVQEETEKPRIVEVKMSDKFLARLQNKK